MVTRREFFSIASAASVRATSRPPLILPVHLLPDTRVKWSSERIRPFWSGIWPEAVRDFERCGIRIQSTLCNGDIWRPPGRQPVVTGLASGVINVVITDQIPVEWDNGLALAGVTTLYRGYHLCMVALNHAHGHQVPLLSLNTCVHELLHVLLHDIFESRPKGLRGESRELRIDWYATGLWLFHDGASIRKAAEAYVERLRTEVASHSGNAGSGLPMTRPTSVRYPT